MRLITDEGLDGLGEAVPLSLRGGADLAAVERGIRKGTRRLRRADLSDFAGAEPTLAGDRRLHPHGRRPPDARPGEGGDRDGAVRPRRQGVGSARSGAARRRRGDAGGLQRDPGRRPTRRRSPPTPSAGPSTGSPPSSSRSAPATTSPRCARCARRSARRPGSASTPTAPGRVDEALGVLAMIEPLEIELVEQPVADARARWPRSRRRPAIPIAADESVAERQATPSAAQRAGACDLATVKLAKVGGIGEANGIAEALPIYLSSALDGPVGIAAAAHAAQALPSRGRGRARPRPRDPAAVRRDDRRRASATLDGDLLQLPDGPGPRGRARRGRAGAAPARSSVRSRWTATNRNTALASAMVEELARCGVRRRGDLPRARARPRWRWRSGASRRSRRASIVDERSRRLLRARRRAGDATPGRGPLHLGHRGGQPPPGRLRGRRGGGAADRAHRRPPAGAARDRRRADDRPAQALRRRRCAGSARSAPTTPTTPACSTSARSPAAPTRPRRRPAAGPGPPERRLARPARPRAAPGRRHRDLAAGARGPRRPAR